MEVLVGSGGAIRRKRGFLSRMHGLHATLNQHRSSAAMHARDLSSTLLRGSRHAP